MYKQLVIIAGIAGLMLMAYPADAQRRQGQGRGHGPGQGKGMMARERIESQQCAFITRQLDLSPNQAQEFWPVYNEYKDKRQELNKEFLGGRPDLQDLEGKSDKELSEMADNIIIHEQKLLDLKKEYHARFKAILPPNKMVKLYQSERDFRRLLMDKMRERRRDNRE